MQILHDIDIAVEAGQIVGLVGANAAGKSTLMFSLRRPAHPLHRRHLHRRRARRRAAGLRAGPARLVLVPERRRLFPFMTVLENLEIGAYSAAARSARRRPSIRSPWLLPVLSERRDQVAGSLSGGEQQMPAIGAR